jgi:hypothetical protein
MLLPMGTVTKAVPLLDLAGSEKVFALFRGSRSRDVQSMNIVQPDQQKTILLPLPQLMLLLCW